MVIQHKPASLLDKQSKMWYPFNCLRSEALGQIMPHVREDRTIGLDDLPLSFNSCKQLLRIPTE
jgi:hypothetical protein